MSVHLGAQPGIDVDLARAVATTLDVAGAVGAVIRVAQSQQLARPVSVGVTHRQCAGGFVIPSWEPWPAEVPGAPARVVYKYPGAAPPVVALTIDDGLHPETCRRMFEYLQAARIPATFFPTLVGVNNDRALWREIAAAGHPIGVHTLTHRDLVAIEDVSVKRQLAGSKRRIERIVKAPLLPVFRPPYGSWDARVLRIAGVLGLHTMALWGPSAGDGSTGALDPARLARNASQGHRGAIVLMHCNNPASADALPLIVAAYRARGYGFVTLPELLKPLPGELIDLAEQSRGGREGCTRQPWESC